DRALGGAGTGAALCCLLASAGGAAAGCQGRGGQGRSTQAQGGAPGESGGESSGHGTTPSSQCSVRGWGDPGPERPRTGSSATLVLGGVLRLPALDRVVVRGAAEQGEVFFGALRHRDGAAVGESAAAQLLRVVDGAGVRDGIVGRGPGALVPGRI